MPYYPLYKQNNFSHYIIPMSIFEDQDTKHITLKQARDSIARLTQLNSEQKGYLHGYFDALEDNGGISGRLVERALRHMKDRTDDNFDSDKVEHLRTELEKLFTKPTS